jgi:5,10-methylenetetrahydromethanopterin reductase
LLELWTPGIPFPGFAEAMAERAEQAGWDGMAFVDSQHLAADTYIGMALAAQRTTRLRLATGVTNPYTRDPAVTASAIGTVQQISGGRAVLGIGRGDSSLAYLGLAPAPVRVLRRYLERLQAYLAGEEPPAGDDHPDVKGVSAGTLPLARTPADRIEWIARSGQPKVPVDVVATGPRVIATGARLAERVTFAVGGDRDRVRWAIETARRARADAGLDPAGVSLGAWVNVAAHPDIDVARRLATPGLFSFARFSAMHGTATGPLRDDDRALIEQIPTTYDMTRHFRRQSGQDAVLNDEFIDRFGIVGPPDRCIERLSELVSLGLERLVVVSGSLDAADRDAWGEAEACLVEAVLPALRRG